MCIYTLYARCPAVGQELRNEADGMLVRSKLDLPYRLLQAMKDFKHIAR